MCPIIRSAYGRTVHFGSLPSVIQAEFESLAAFCYMCVCYRGQVCSWTWLFAQTPSGLPIYNMSNEAAQGARKILISLLFSYVGWDPLATAQTAPLKHLYFYCSPHTFYLFKSSWMLFWFSLLPLYLIFFFLELYF